MIKSSKKLKWWQLSILGIGFIIGSGYFLGSVIAIQSAGPGVLITFALAAAGTYTVYDVLSRMTAEDPKEGSFSLYSQKAYGRWAGFSSGWVYWSSEMFIMGSQLTGISIFTTFWFQSVPLWVCAIIYTVLGITVVLIGIHWFERLGSFFAISKLSAVILFIILAILGLSGVFKETLQGGGDFGDFFPNGITGLWGALLFSFYAFGGIEIISIYSTRLQNPRESPKAGKIMLLLLTSIYLLSLGLAVYLLPLQKYSADESPFITALDGLNLTFIPHLFNSVLIIAGFSTMTASLFAVTTMVGHMAREGNAPKFLGRKGKLTVPLPALILTSGGLICSIIIGFLLPDRVYEYITTAAGLMLLYNWLFILWSAKKLLVLSAFDHFKRYLGTLLIILASGGACLKSSSRPGFLISFGFFSIILLIGFIMHRRWNKKGGGEPGKQTSLFEKLIF